MKPLLLKILNSRFGWHFARIGVACPLILATLWVCVLATPAASETITANDNKNTIHQIRIIADKLLAEVDAGIIDFVGNVKATHAETVITADRLRIFYDPDTIKSQTDAPKTESIEKIIATGHVKILYDNITAETDKAEYIMKSEVLILTGKQSKVTQQGHSITGAKFTLQRSDGRLTVESRGENRVKAVIQGSEKNN